MRKVCFVIFIISISLTYICQCQTKVVQPTELEQAKLAKLKAQNDTLQEQLRQIDVQIQALTILKQLTTEHQQSKLSEWLNYSEDVKMSHKEWGDKKNITYNQQQGESGSFTVDTKETTTKK